MTFAVPERKQVQSFKKSAKLVHLLANLFYFRGRANVYTLWQKFLRYDPTRYSLCFSWQGCTMEQRATRLLAGAAGLGADTTVVKHGGMALAFGRADAASLGAGHQLRLHQHRARLREA